MPHPKLKTLHARLFTIVLLAMLPVLIMALLMAKARYQEAKASALADSRLLALRYSGEGKALFDRVRILMSELAELPEVRSLDSAACAEILIAQGRVHPAYGPITLSRPDGGTIASSRPQSGRQSLSGQDWFSDLLREKSFVVGGYQGARGGEPARLPLALPILAQDGAILAVLSMSLDLRELADLLDGLSLPDGAAVTIIDRSGIILARFPADPRAVGRPAPEADSFLPHFMSNEVNTWESAGVDGVERLYFLAPLLKQKQQGIVLRIGLPKEKILAAADHGLVRDLLFIAAMTALALFSTWFFSNAYVLDQVKKLWLATKKMSEGDYGHRIGETGSGELAELAMAFDGMADVLESKTVKLVTAEHKYRKIFEDSVNGIFQTTPDGRVLVANPALAGMLGFSSPQEMIRSVSDIASQLYSDPAMRQEVQERLKRDGVVTGFEFRARHTDGGLVWLSLDVRAIRDPDGVIALYEGIATDITERKQAEDVIRSLAKFPNENPNPVMRVSGNNTVTHANPPAQEILRQLGSGIGELCPDRFHAPLSEAQMASQPRMCEMLVDNRVFEFTLAPIISEGYFNIYGLDITERKRAEEALRATQAFTQTVIDSSPDCIKVLDAEGRLEFMNQGGQRLLGITDLVPFLGRHYLEFWSQADVLKVSRAMEAAWQGGSQGRFKGFCPTLGGEPRWWDVLVTPLNHGSEKQRKLLVVSRDVTEGKQAELALRASQELLAHTQAIGRIGGWSINLDTKERKWTKELDHLLDLKGGPLPDIEGSAGFVAPEDQERYFEVMRRAEELGEPVDVELRLAPQGTTQRWVRLMGKREDKDGARMLVGSVQDITDRKNLELLRDDIDSIVRHDLKTPLNAIINLPRIIMGGSNLTPDQIEYLGYIETGGKKMLRQVEMSLDIMKIERGHFQYRPYPFDLLGMVRSIVGEMLEPWQQKQLSVEILLGAEPAEDSSTFVVSAEERLCSPMLSNLIANAIEASPAGERITIALNEGAEHVEHVVSIRNIGAVPADIRERFFEKYVTSGKFKGTGLGTYSARLFAMAQSGTVELDASEEGATTVVVRLPRNSAPGVV